MGLTFETLSILGISSPVVFLLTVVYVFAFLVWNVAMAALFWRGAGRSAAASAPVPQRDAPPERTALRRDTVRSR